MATRIRLKRGGRKGKPYYRIVVQDSRTRSRGRELDIIGYYHPTARPEPVSEVNVHSALDWLRNGAEMSDTARSVLSKLGVLKHFHAGTRPDESTATLKGGVVENKGFNPPPPPKEDAPEEAAPAEEPVADAAEEVPVPEEVPAPEASDDAAEVTEEA